MIELLAPRVALGEFDQVESFLRHVPPAARTRSVWVKLLIAGPPRVVAQPLRAASLRLAALLPQRR